MGVSHHRARAVLTLVPMAHWKFTVGFATLLALPGVVGQAHAADATRDPVLSEQAGPVDAAERLPTRAPVVGLSADAGVPDGLMGSLVLRPTPIVRLHLGVGSNSASPGLRAGATILPFVTGPSFTLEAGHYLAGDASGLAQTFFRGIGKFATYVGKIDYDFVNAHLGLDLARGDWTFFIHGGFTYLRATLSQVQVPADAGNGSNNPTTLTFREDPVLRMFTPSVKLGLVYYLQ